MTGSVTLDDVWDLVQRCWFQVRADRPTMEEVMSELPNVRRPVSHALITLP